MWGSYQAWYDFFMKQHIAIAAAVFSGFVLVFTLSATARTAFIEAIATTGVQLAAALTQSETAWPPPHMSALPADYKDRLYQTLANAYELVGATISCANPATSATCTPDLSTKWVAFGTIALALNTPRVSEVNTFITDKFYWRAAGPLSFAPDSSHYMRFYGLFNSRSPYMPGRLSVEAQTAFEKEMWSVAQKYSKLAEASLGPWTQFTSENITLARAVNNMFAAQFLKHSTVLSNTPPPVPLTWVKDYVSLSAGNPMVMTENTTTNAPHRIYALPTQSQVTATDILTFTFEVQRRGAPRDVLAQIASGGLADTFAKARCTLEGEGSVTGVSGARNTHFAASIVLLGDGWYRCTLTVQPDTVAGSVNLQIRLQNGSLDRYTGDGTSGVELRNISLQRGSASTSIQYADGSTFDQQYEAWRAYVSNWLDERMRRGLFIEAASPSYEEESVAQIFNLRDFAEDPILKKKAEMFIDLYYANMAEEMLLTSRGGPKSRVKEGAEYSPGSSAGYNLLFNAPGRTWAPTNHAYLPTSNYYPPAAVVGLAADVIRGVYVYSKRVPGVLISQADGKAVIDVDRSVLRYGFWTPEYVLGSAGLNPSLTYNGSSGGFRWQGVMFKGDERSLIMFELVPASTGGYAGFDEFLAVQDRNVLVTKQWLPVPQNLNSHHPAQTRIYISQTIDQLEEDPSGWIFVKEGGAYGAIKIVQGGYHWTEPWAHTPTYQGARTFVVLDTKDSPIVLVMNQASDYPSFEAFKTAIRSQSLSAQGDTVAFGGTTYELSKTSPAKIGGTSVDLSPIRVNDSPFIRSDWKSGLIYIRKGSDTEVLDNRNPMNPIKMIGTTPSNAFPTGTGSATPIIFTVSTPVPLTWIKDFVSLPTGSPMVMIENTTANAPHRIYALPTQAQVTATDLLTFSFEAKRIGAPRDILVQIANGGITESFAKTHCTLSGEGIAAGTPGIRNSSFSTSITALGGGWYRCMLMVRPDSVAGSTNLQIRLQNGSLDRYTGDGISGVELRNISLTR